MRVASFLLQWRVESAVGLNERWKTVNRRFLQGETNPRELARRLLYRRQRRSSRSRHSEVVMDREAIWRDLSRIGKFTI